MLPCLRLIAYVLPAGCLLSSCDLPDDAAFRSAPPATQLVTVAFPGVSTTSPRPPPVDKPLRDPDAANYFGVSQDAALLVNMNALKLLTVARVMVQLPATSRLDPHRTFGPYQPGGTDPFVYRLVVTQTLSDAFSYTLAARLGSSKTSDDFVPVLEGFSTRDTASASARGRMTVLFDNRRKLDPLLCEQGRLDFDYDSYKEPAELIVTLKQALSQTVQGGTCPQVLRDGSFFATHDREGNGRFVFDVRQNVHDLDPSRGLPETLLVLSRWDKTGQGRADGKIADGEITQDLLRAGLSARYVSFSQCWDKQEKTVFQHSEPTLPPLLPTVGQQEGCWPVGALFPE